MILSPKMREAVDKAHEHGGTLVREPGGFWTYPGCTHTKPAIPDWHVGIYTVKALVIRGLANFTKYESDRYGYKFPVAVEVVSDAK
jgi:hypothetical protein